MNTDYIIYSLGLLFIAASFIKLLKIDHWSIRFFDFPQVHFMVFGILVLSSGFIWLDTTQVYNLAFMVLIASVIMYQASLIFPYTALANKEVETCTKKDECDIRILVSNVYQPNESYSKVLNLIKKENPDVVLLVETNARWEAHCEELNKIYPYSLKKPLDNMYGLLFFSKLELKEARIRYILKDDIPSVKTKLVLHSGEEVQFYGLHPEPPSPTENDESTDRDAELYLLAREIKADENCPTIVAGDLNDVAWSKSTKIFQRTSRLLDPRKGRGLFNTFHAGYSLIRWPLDHFFVSQHFKLIDIYVHENVGSDHFPISVALQYQPHNDNGSPDALEKEEQEEATEQIDKATSENE